MKKGVFVTLEGGEGSGKTTQLPLIAKWLESLGREVVTTREPGGTPLGASIRALLLRSGGEVPVARAELMLYGADRAQHVQRVIAPALAEGKVVLCDRYADATEAYQGHGRGIDLNLVRTLNEAATGGLKPDRTVWIDIDPELGVKRSLARLAGDTGGAESRFEEEQLAFHKRVREGYAGLANTETGRFRRVDGNGTVAEVFERVQAALADLFPDSLP